MRRLTKFITTFFLPVKAIKGECQEIRNRDKASNDLYSTAVSGVRQPIESLFNWLIEKTKSLFKIHLNSL